MRLWHAFIRPTMAHFRRRRVALLRQACPELFDDSPARVLDLGGSRHFWENMPVDLQRKQVVIYNIDHGETASSGRAASIPIKLYDGIRLPEADGSFDVVVCNSVIEHVPRELRAGLVAEMRRVGRHLLLQAPAREFPVEPHFVMPFLHWMPRPIGQAMVFMSPWFWLSRPGRAHAVAYFEEIRLPSASEINRLVPDGTVYRERVAGLVKSYIVSAGRFRSPGL